MNASAADLQFSFKEGSFRSYTVMGTRDSEALNPIAQIMSLLAEYPSPP